MGLHFCTLHLPCMCLFLLSYHPHPLVTRQGQSSHLSSAVQTFPVFSAGSSQHDYWHSMSEQDTVIIRCTGSHLVGKKQRSYSTYCRSDHECEYDYSVCVNMIISCWLWLLYMWITIVTRMMWESSRSPQALASSDDASSVKLEEQASILPLVATH